MTSEDPMLVVKKKFSTTDYKTVGGKNIPEIHLGYETFGQLNEKKDNAVFVCTFLTGNSHCAGRYKQTDKNPGYWDKIIGPNKPFDTNKYFVVSADPICCLNVKDPNVITTGPASIDPSTGRPYAMNFPIICIRDHVNVHKRLLDSLGVQKLRAVIGWSMGAPQTMEWGAQFPNFVERLIPVCGRGLRSPSHFMLLHERQNEAIVSDPNWKEGNYYDGPGPTVGLTNALKLITLWAREPVWANSLGGRSWQGEDPLDSFSNSFEVERRLHEIATARAINADANSLLYLNRANHLYAIDERTNGNQKFIRSPTLLICEESDLLSLPSYARETFDELISRHVPARIFDLRSGAGHFAGISEIERAGPIIRDFLAAETSADLANLHFSETRAIPT